MANEIKVVASLQCTNGSFKLPKFGGDTQSITQTTLGGGVPGYVSIGTSEEDITLTDIGTNGWCWMKNCDTANFIKFGPKSAGAMIEFGRLFAGEECVFRLAAGVTMRAIADTAAVKCQIVVVNS